jgi:hypothetical protein
MKELEEKERDQDIWNDMYDAWITRIVARLYDFYRTIKDKDYEQNVGLLLNDEDLIFARDCWKWELKEIQLNDEGIDAGLEKYSTKELMDKFGRSIIKTK